MGNGRIRALGFGVLGVFLALGLVAPGARADVDKEWCDNYYHHVWGESCRKQSDSEQVQRCWRMANEWYAKCLSGQILQKTDQPVGTREQAWESGSTRL